MIAWNREYWKWKLERGKLADVDKTSKVDVGLGMGEFVEESYHMNKEEGKLEDNRMMMMPMLMEASMHWSAPGHGDSLGTK